MTISLTENTPAKLSADLDLSWFFEAYAALCTGRADRERIRDRLAASGSDAVTAGLALYLLQDCGEAGSHASVDALGGVAIALEHQLTGDPDAPLWQLAMWTAVLRRAGRPEHAHLTARAKNHAYAHYVREGTLVADSGRSTVDYTVLLASIPFGLFEPEDLALVEAVDQLEAPQRLASATDGEKLILAWYCCERGRYAQSRALLAESDNAPLAAIVTHALRQRDQLAQRFIRHAPAGNGNRYEPLYEERFPKLVSDTDTVTVRLRAAPLSPIEPVELLLDDEVIAGQLEDDGWRFDIPPRPVGTHVTYRFRFAGEDEMSGAFAYSVLRRRVAGQVRALYLEGAKAVAVYDRACLTIAVEAGQPTLAFTPGDSARTEEPGNAVNDAVVLDRYSVHWEPQSGHLVIDEGDHVLGCIERFDWLETEDGEAVSIEARFAVPRCGIFGLGERYNSLDQYGERVDQFVYNQYKDQGLRTYMPMPVFYTDAGFGAWLATDSYSWFDFDSGGEGRLVMGTEAGALRLHLLSGPVSRQVSQFIDLTGAPRNVPDWALGPWMSSNNWDNQAEIERQLALTREHGVPATVLVIEAWSDEATFYIFNDAIYEPKEGEDAFAYKDFTFPEWGRWPDPKGMVEAVHEQGLRLILWQIPVIKHAPALRHAQKDRDEQTFIAEGFGVRHPDGAPFRLPEGWFKDSLLMDFTNRAGREWWFAKRRYLIDLGVDGFKTDGGEMVWGQDLVFADGTTGLINRNRYPGDYISAYYDFAQANGGITFSRAGYTGAQSYPAHWAGDERSTWAAFKRSILAGLSAGMSGVIFWGWDLGGFSGEVPGAELFIRSAQMACFCPIMQYHAESKAEFNQDRTPWNIAERSGDIRALTCYAFYARLRMALLPYLTTEAAHCIEARTPLMRAMLLDHADDPNASALWDQYQFGRDLMVAPVIEEAAQTRQVYFPEGRWWHLLAETWFEGPGVQRIAALIEDIPVFVRAGALLPLAFDAVANFGAERATGMIAPQQYVLLYAMAPGSSARYTNGATTIEVACDDNGAVSCTTRGTSSTCLALAFTDMPASVSVNGNFVPLTSLTLHRKSLSAVVVTAAD
jgi:alpha-D-xyloside xylohydrolase